MQNILQLTALYLRIIFLRAKPQDVPATNAVFWASITASVITFVIAISPEYGLFDALARVAMGLVILSAILHGGLVVSGHNERFLQGYAAFCGTAALINIAFWPVISEISGSGTAAEPNSLAFAALLLLHVWSVVVAAHIFRHCFGSSLTIGVMISITYLIVAIMAANFLFPVIDGTVGAVTGN